jgi:hypothetical protein
MEKDLENGSFDATLAQSQSKPQRHRENEEILNQSSDEQDPCSGQDGTSDQQQNRERDELALTWTRTQESQHNHTMAAKTERKQRLSSLPKMGGGRPYPPDLLQPEEYLVDFDGSRDPTHPQNWPMRTKFVPVNSGVIWILTMHRAVITAILCTTTFITTFASAVYAPAISIIAKDYKVAPEVATLGVTLYVLGFSAG